MDEAEDCGRGGFIGRGWMGQRNGAARPQFLKMRGWARSVGEVGPYLTLYSHG